MLALLLLCRFLLVFLLNDFVQEFTVNGKVNRLILPLLLQILELQVYERVQRSSGCRFMDHCLLWRFFIIDFLVFLKQLLVWLQRHDI